MVNAWSWEIVYDLDGYEHLIEESATTYLSQYAAEIALMRAIVHGNNMIPGGHGTMRRYVVHKENQAFFELAMVRMEGIAESPDVHMEAVSSQWVVVSCAPKS